MTGRNLPAVQDGHSALDDLAAQIHAEVEATEADWRASLAHAIRAGELLIEAKSKCRHGGWLPWLETNFEFTRQTATGYMRAAEHKDEMEGSPSISLEAALKLLGSRRDHHRKDKLRRDELRALEGATIDVSFEAHTGDFRTALAAVQGAAAIITDPPYAAEFMPLYGEMAECAKRWLRPRGVCAVMCGQMHLPTAMAELAAHLDYHWTMTYLTPGGQAVQIFPRSVNTFWKPIVLLTNGPADSVIDGEWLGDVAKSDVNDNDKDHHKWGQSESGMTDLLKRLTVPGDTVIDPFMGAGTTGVAALTLGRSFIGCDTDKGHVATARKRMKQVERERGQGT